MNISLIPIDETNREAEMMQLLNFEMQPCEEDDAESVIAPE